MAAPMRIVDKILDSLTPAQVCWSCLAITLIACSMAFRVFATNVEVQSLRKRVDIAARLSLTKEIRDFQRNACLVSDRTNIEIYLERLQVEYQDITGTRYPEYRCPNDPR